MPHRASDEGGRPTDSPETGTDQPAASDRISMLRRRIDEIDGQIIALWQERAAASQEVGATRIASGGTRLVLSRERVIMERYREGMGPDGTQVALLILRAGRGPLGGTESSRDRGVETS
nr:chorismate mutase [Actinocatenispora comari]